MSVSDEHEYELTQSKLEDVRRVIASIERRPVTGNPAARAASLRSLRAYENQLVEELVRYETQHGREPRTLARSAAPTSH
jgi:hypothetical protein